MILARGLGNILLTRQLRQLSLKATAKKSSAPIAVLFPAENLQIQRINLEFCKELEAMAGVKALPLVYLPKKLNRNVRFSFPHYSYGDLTLLGRPNNKHIDLYLQRRYHSVINLDVNNHSSLHFLSHRISAHHKLAIQPIFPKLYDIVIRPDADADIPSVQSEILEILTTLKIFK